MISQMKALLSSEEFVVKSIQKIKDQKGKAKGFALMLSSTSLAACGSGSLDTGSKPMLPAIFPSTGFAQDPTGTYTGTDLGDTLGQSGSAIDLTVFGGAGDDTITTGSGNDMIRGGLGVDTIDAGEGNDIIIVVGSTTADQYMDSSITDPAGTGFDLSALISS